MKSYKWDPYQIYSNNDSHVRGRKCSMVTIHDGDAAAGAAGGGAPCGYQRPLTHANHKPEF